MTFFWFLKDLNSIRNKGTVGPWQKIIINILIIIINNYCWNLKLKAGIQDKLYGFLCLIAQNTGQHSVGFTFKLVKYVLCILFAASTVGSGPNKPKHNVLTLLL